MTTSWPWADARRAVVLAGILGLAGVALEAQEPRGTELGVAGVATAADPAFTGGGAYFAFRPEARVRVALVAMPGVIAGRAAGRGELAAHFLLSPDRRRGAGVYGAAGIAGTLAGGKGDGYLLLGLGLEWAPGGGSGWALEAGVGGGFRVAVGWRWRQLRRQGDTPP